MNRRILIDAVAALCLVGLLALNVNAGPLDPPTGPISPTGKVIGEIEPRIAVSAANTPGDATAVFRITKPGSYYLTGNVKGEIGKSGVAIDVSNVALDLNGFTLEGVPGSISGVISNSASGTTVLNGTVRAWGSTGVNVQGSGNRFEGLITDSNGVHGMLVGSGAVVRGCTARSNAFSGISASSATTVVDCAAVQNTKSGFFGGGRALFRGCTAEGNGTAGFDVSFGSAVIDCVSGSNLAQGIRLHLGGIARNCTVTTNSTHGIETDADATISDCVCDGNGTSGTGAGILATSLNNRIESNNCTDNKIGISVTGTKNFISRNTCANNTTNWSVAVGNKCLVVLGVNSSAQITGDAGGAAIGSTDPNANFTY